MKITILYDNTVFKPELEADWGFACVIDVHDKRRILFDTGASGRILFENMKKLGIDPRSIDIVFISHNHFDHIGGLSQVLDENTGLLLYTPFTLRGVTRAKKIVSVKDRPAEIYPGVFSTGVMQDIEQSLLIRTNNRMVIITGCSHPGVKKILDTGRRYGSIYALIGGLHDFADIAALEGIPLICPTHCTKRVAEIKRAYPKACLEGGTGREIII